MSRSLVIAASLLAGLISPASTAATRRPDDPMPERAEVRLGASAEDGTRPGEEAGEPFAPRGSQSALLRRWNNLTPQEQGKLRERFEHFKTIEAAERERLTKRGKRLDLLARQLYRELPDEDRARMDALPAAKRRELMREMAADKARDVGQRIHDKLPPHLRRRLARAAPEDRARFLEEFRARGRERMGEVLVQLGEELEIEPSIIQRISRLPDDQRAKKLLEFLQRRASVEVGRRGLPPGVTLEQWHAIGELPGDEFFEAIMGLREAYPALAMPPFERRPSDARQRLALAGRPRPAERIELSDWSPADRRGEVLRRRRARVERVLRDESLISAEELAGLGTLSDGAYLIQVRKLVFDRE